MIGKLLAVFGSLIRLALAGAFLWLCWQDWPTVQSRDAFENLPPYDAAAEANELFKQDRIPEALLLVDDALARDPGNSRLQVIKQGLEIERKNWMRQLASGGRGALTGQGNDVASLTGAVVADLFVFGDLRDLVIQSGHWLRGEETDDLIVALSVGGILLTVSPAIDLGAALLKLARRMGALSDTFAKSVADVARQAVKKRSADAVAAITEDVATLSKRATPSGAISILKHVDDPAMLRLVARFSEKPDGLRALILDPATTLRWLKSGWIHSETWLLKAAGKGRHGLEYLARNSSLMFKPHPLLGLVKGLYKGNIPDLALAMVREWALPILGFALAWAAFELLLLLSRIVGLVPSGPRPAPAPQ